MCCDIHRKSAGVISAVAELFSKVRVIFSASIAANTCARVRLVLRGKVGRVSRKPLFKAPT